MPETILPAPRRRFFATSLGLLVLTYLGFVSLGLPDGALGVAWPTLRVDFERSQAAFGGVLAMTALGFLGSSMFAGAAVARFGAGVLLAGSTLIVGVGLGLVALSPSWELLLLAAVVAGFGGGAIDAGLNSYAAGHYSAKHMNWLHAAFGAGAGIGPAIMTAALPHGGWRLGYAVIAFVMLAMAVLFLTTRRGFGDQVRAAEPVATAPVGEALRDSLVWLQVTAFFIYVGVEIGAAQWAYAVLRARGFGLAEAGALTSAFWIALFAGRLLLGFGADRIGPVRLIRFGVLGALAGAALFLFSPLGLGPLGLVLIGFACAPVYPMLMHRTPVVLGRRIAPRAIGMQVSAAMIGGVALPALSGFAADAYGLGAPLVVNFVSAIILVAVIEATLRIGARRAALLVPA